MFGKPVSEIPYKKGQCKSEVKKNTIFCLMLIHAEKASLLLQNPIAYYFEKNENFLYKSVHKNSLKSYKM
jgi:hypothetical protein